MLSDGWKALELLSAFFAVAIFVAGVIAGVILF